MGGVGWSWWLARALRAVCVQHMATWRASWFLLREAWHEKTVASIYATSVTEENRLRWCRHEIAAWIGVTRLSPEEFLVFCSRLAEHYVVRRLHEPLTKTEACRIILNRRRFRP